MSGIAEARQKFARAELHTKEFTSRVRRWTVGVGKRGAEFTKRYEPENQRFVYAIGRRFYRPLPPSWPLLVGDALFNYRAALDYLAWTLVENGSTPSVLSNRPQTIQFPIIEGDRLDKSGGVVTRAEDRFWTDVGRGLPGVPRPRIDLIRDFQPYRWRFGKTENHPLALLQLLNNHDKHRELQVVREVSISGHVSLLSAEHCRFLRSEPLTPDRFDPGVEIFRVYVIPDETGDPEITMNIAVPIVPVFDEERFDQYVALADIRKTVDSILSAFDNVL